MLISSLSLSRVVGLPEKSSEPRSGPGLLAAKRPCYNRAFWRRLASARARAWPLAIHGSTRPRR